MTDHQDPRHAQYERVRDAFDDLQIEEKAVFLVKETINTIFEGVGEVVRSFSDEFDAMFGGAPAAEPEAEEEAAAENGAAKKTTSRRKTAATKGGSTTKKTTTRKTTAKKATTRKKAADKDDGGDT